MGLVTKLPKNSIFNCDILNLFTLSNQITLVDSSGQPVIFEFNGKYYFFTFEKQHYNLNLNNNQSDFKFFEKLYLADLLKPDYKWKNLLNISFLKALKDYIPLEPRNLFVEIIDCKPKFSINSYNMSFDLVSFSNLVKV